MNEYDPNYVRVKNFFLLGVKVIIVNEKNEVLILKRSNKIPGSGEWGFPGGGVDANEAPEQAAIREVQEEAQIDIKEPKIFASVFTQEDDEQAVILGFSAKVSEAAVTLNWEHDAYEWVAFDDLSSYDLPELHSRLLEAYLHA